MINIDPKFKKDVETIRAANKAHDAMIDYFINKLGERIGLKTNQEYEILWDHILNESNWNVSYKKGKHNESSS
jgi:hypothetical protein